MDTGFIANRLVNEAFKNGAEDNITIVIRVEKTSSSSQLAPQSRKGQKFQVKPSYREDKYTLHRQC